MLGVHCRDGVIILYRYGVKAFHSSRTPPATPQLLPQLVGRASSYACSVPGHLGLILVLPCCTLA